MFEINKIKHAFIKNEKRTNQVSGLVYLLQNGNYKILVTNQCDDMSHVSNTVEPERLVNAVDLKKFLESKELDALLYDYKFQMKKTLTIQQIIDIYNLIRFERYLDDNKKIKISEMCSVISAYLVLKLGVPEEKQQQFNTIIKKYLMLDAIASSRSCINWFVTKENEVIDYKLLRTFKGCSLDTSKLKQVENLKIRVSDDNIFISENGKEEQLIYGSKPLEPQKIIKIGYVQHF